MHIVTLLLSLVLSVIPASTAKATAATKAPVAPPTLETITLGGGCFWCTEAVFEELKGVEKIESGYSGGTVASPSYEQVSTGKTGHAEVSEIT